MYYLLFSLLSLSGEYSILSGFFPVTSLKSRRAIRKVIKSNSKPSSSLPIIERMTSLLSKRIAPLIRLSKLRYVQLESTLRSSGLSETPEQFTANALAEFLLLISICVPLFFIFRIACVAAIAFAIYYLVTRFQKLNQSSAEKARIIEMELPRFVSYVNSGLSTSSNALFLMERYITDNAVFAEELNRTIADIKTSTFELALLRFGARFSSEHLSMLIRGLIGIYNGDDVRYYFEMLNKDFAEIETDRLRLEVKKIPQKMKKSMIVIYASIALLYFTPVAILITESLQKFFS